MPTAAEVVKAYQDKKRVANAGDRDRELIEAATRDVVDAFGGANFDAKDVRACVADVLADTLDSEQWSQARRSRIVNKTLASLVAGGELSLDANENYVQLGGRRAAVAAP